MDIVKASELWRKQIKTFYTGGTISELLAEGSHREIRKTVEAAIIDAHDTAASNVGSAAESAMSWLNSWAQHVGTCPDGQVCTCGLDAIRQELAVALQPLT